MGRGAEKLMGAAWEPNKGIHDEGSTWNECQKKSSTLVYRDAPLSLNCSVIDYYFLTGRPYG